jgi:hypothetical protein
VVAFVATPMTSNGHFTVAANKEIDIRDTLRAR